jgi:phage tail tape-measure protein
MAELSEPHMARDNPTVFDEGHGPGSSIDERKGGLAGAIAGGTLGARAGPAGAIGGALLGWAVGETIHDPNER